MPDYYMVTIDGPAGSGKTTAAQGLARRLGIKYFNSGALYRAVAWMGLNSGIDLDDSSALLGRLKRTRVETREVDGVEHVFLDGRDVTVELFKNEISREVYRVADPAEIRREVGKLAHKLNADRSFVTEGRDQGTEVFPEADVKFYLDARPEVRAERRRVELEQRGEKISGEELLRQILERDERDRTREIGALRRAPDAICLDNSDVGREETVDRMVKLVKDRLGAQGPPGTRT
jgi:cytidylate kinase